MTAREVYQDVLIEQNKSQAPSILLEDFIYFANKAINQIVNKIYNSYDMNQQKSDDLRVLKSTAVLIPLENDFGPTTLFSNVYEVDLPDDYLHILNCVVEYTTSKVFKCYKSGEIVHFGAKRMTADMFPQLINNYYMRPSYKNPYFYINNVNTQNTFKTKDNVRNIWKNINLHTFATEWTSGTKYYVNDVIKVSESGLNNIVTFYRCMENHTSTLLFNAAPYNLLGSITKSLIDNWTPFYADLSFLFKDKISTERYGNNSRVRMEIRYGKNNTFAISKIYVDYIKVPQYITLTQEQIDGVEDQSQLLEFPDYVCQEIINELIKLLLENTSDPRLQTNIPISQSISEVSQGQQKR